MVKLIINLDNSWFIKWHKKFERVKKEIFDFFRWERLICIIVRK